MRQPKGLDTTVCRPLSDFQDTAKDSFQAHDQKKVRT